MWSKVQSIPSTCRKDVLRSPALLAAMSHFPMGGSAGQPFFQAAATEDGAGQPAHTHGLGDWQGTPPAAQVGAMGASWHQNDGVPNFGLGLGGAMGAGPWSLGMATVPGNPNWGQPVPAYPQAQQQVPMQGLAGGFFPGAFPGQVGLGPAALCRRRAAQPLPGRPCRPSLRVRVGTRLTQGDSSPPLPGSCRRLRRRSCGHVSQQSWPRSSKPK